MTNQGLYGAIKQGLTFESKPRLDRKNTWFRDHGYLADYFWIIFTMLAMVFAIYLTVKVML